MPGDHSEPAAGMAEPPKSAEGPVVAFRALEQHSVTALLGIARIWKVDTWPGMDRRELDAELRAAFAVAGCDESGQPGATAGEALGELPAGL